MPLQILPAYDHIEDIRDLFTAYVRMLGVDLSFQNFQEEFYTLPGKYAPPGGMLLLALYDSLPVGCVAFHALDG